MEVKISIAQSDGSVVEVIKEVESAGNLGTISVTESLAVGRSYLCFELKL